MAKPESEIPWEMDITNPDDSQDKKFDIVEETHDFAKFIADAPVNFINILTVFPTVAFGIMYSMSIGTIESYEKIGEEVDIEADTFLVDNRILNLLQDSLQNLSAEEEAETTILRKNLLIVLDTINNPFNWGDPFNTRSDN